MKPARSMNREAVACLCWKGEPDDPLYLIVKTDGKRWTFPKGHVKAGEEPRKAASRETREETGIGVKPERHPFTSYLYDGKDGEQTVMAYLARLDLSTEPTTAEHGRKVRWENFEWTVARLAHKRKTKYVAEHVRVLRLASQRLSPNLSRS